MHQKYKHLLRLLLLIVCRFLLEKNGSMVSKERFVIYKKLLFLVDVSLFIVVLGVP